MAKRAYAHDEDGKRRVDAATRWVEGFREKQLRRQRRFIAPFDDLKIYNGTNEAMPQYGIGRAGSMVTINDEKFVTVEKPDTTFSRDYLVNNSDEIAYQRTGVSKNRPVIKVLYDTGTPAVGETWGPNPGSWEASKGYPGLTCLGIVDATNKIMLARVEPYDTIVGKLTGLLADGGNTVNVWAGVPGSEAYVTGWQITAYPWWDVGSCTYPVSSTAKVICKFIGGRWRILPLPWDKTQISGWSSGTKQYLAHDTSGCLLWQGVSSC